VNTLALYLTARGETENRVKGLNIGADAYLVKPFAFPELLAMIRSLLKRKNAVRDSVVRIGDLEIDPVAHRVLRAGQRLNLTLKEFRLLYLMASREGEVLSRAQIGEHVWNMKLDCENNIVDVHIGRLRLKVDDPFEKKLIHTIRGVGYVLRLEE
jgi:two-component system copper resistance phosphate regulon response regulator CusR